MNAVHHASKRDLPGAEQTQQQNMSSINPEDVAATYRRYAPIYDRLFGAVLEPGRKALAKVVTEIAPKSLLEVGVGTGLMLRRYAANTHVVGIDLSEEMLEIARKRARVLEYKMHNIELVNMNAEELAFPDSTFDCVTLPYVLSVTPHPEKLVAEIRRVCKKDGTILILNHFSGSRFWWVLERAVRRIADRVGFQSEFDFAGQIEKYDWQIQRVQPVNMFALSKLVTIRNV
jgi:phosphatidylethanolamine/phosphatidyl-N-methylethanolamine N-methyltransferase